MKSKPKLPTEIQIPQHFIHGSFNPDVAGGLKNVIGQEEAVAEMQSLIATLNASELVEFWGIRPPKGVLLEGPPGTGKTFLVRNFYSDLVKTVKTQAILFELSYRDIASKWVDQPIEILNEFFKNVEEKSKTQHVIVFIDEIDSMIPQRNEMMHETSSKRVNLFLEWMDGGLRTNQNITLIGATNYSDGVDEAARRPGRFDKIIRFNRFNPDDSLKCLKHYFEQCNFDSRQSSKINWGQVKKSFPIKELTGAEVASVIDRLKQKKFNEHIAKLSDTNANASKDIFSIKNLPSPICTNDIIDELCKMAN